MGQLKYYNESTGQWEVTIAGAQGPVGPQGEVGPGVAAGGTAGQIVAKVDGTDFNTEWIDNYTEQIKHTVKAGEALTKGQAVYVSSANGTNMIVSKASNDSESTSSKTMGLIAQSLANNGQGFVITEGLLEGLNTLSATAGDPVWLGTAGNLLYGVSNKPVAPAHMVFIGIITRVHATEGEIFIKVQNGFELNELHDVNISSPAAGELVVRNSTNTLWENATLAEAGVSAVGHTHDDRYYTETETDTAISNAIAGLVDTAPATLDTLNELAAAINDDASFASTVTTALAGKSDTSHTHDDRYYTETETDTLLNAKASLSGATFTGDITANNIKSNRTNSVNEGGQLELAKAVDNNTAWTIDAYGSTSTPDLRFFDFSGNVRLKVDTSGRVTMPYQTSFKSYSSTITSGSGIFKNYTTSDGGIHHRYRNIGNNFNTSTGVFTAPVAGRYLISAMYGQSSGVVERNIGWLYINGTNIGEWIESYGQYDDVQAAQVFYLNANDYVQVATHDGIRFDNVVLSIDLLG